MDIFAQRLKWLREKKGLTQKEVADHMGVSQQYYGRFEKGQAQPNLEAFGKLHEYFQEHLEFLLGLYDLDEHAAMLFDIVRDKKKKYDKHMQRIEDLLNIIKSEDVDDIELKERISGIIKEETGSYSEKHEYDRAKEYFVDYYLSIPGVTKEMVSEAHINELQRFYEGLTTSYRDAYLAFHDKMNKERLDNQDT